MLILISVNWFIFNFLEGIWNILYVVCQNVTEQDHPGLDKSFAATTVAEDGNALTEKGSKDELEQSFSDLNIDDNRGGQYIFEHSETGEIPSNDNDTTIDYFDEVYWHANYT